MMKKILLTLILIATFILPLSANAGVWENCNWIWDGISSVNQAPTAVYCSNANSDWKSKGVAYIQNTRNATSVAIQYDTTYNNSKVINGVTVCSNTVSDGDLNVLSCIDNVCDTGTTTVAYYQVNAIADAINKTFELTPPAEGFKLTVDENTNPTCVVARTAVWWEEK